MATNVRAKRPVGPVQDRQEVGLFTRHVELALDVLAAHSHKGVGRIGDIGAVHDEEIAVEVGLERPRGQRPDALFVLGHRLVRCRPVAAHFHVLGVGCPQPKRDLAVGANHRRRYLAAAG